MPTIFKILDADAWSNAAAAGVFHGSPVDLADGFIHFSAANQVRETAARHFSGRRGLVLVAFDDSTLGPALRWETSRGGQLFPHLFGPLDTRLAVWVKALPWTGSGHAFPPETKL